MTASLFTFAHVADTHLWHPENGHLTDENRQWPGDVVTPLVDALNAETHHPRPDFVVFAGDNIHGDPDDPTTCEKETRMLKERLHRLEMPYHILCDNHDTWGEDPVSTRMIRHADWDAPPNHVWHPPMAGSQFRRFFGEDAPCCARELPGNFTAIFLSEHYVDPTTGVFVTLGDARLAWLDQALQSAAGRHVLLFTHSALISPRYNQSQDSRPGDNNRVGRWMLKDHPAAFRRMRELLATHGNVVAHYSGHTHVHSHAESDGTHFVGTAALYNEPAEYRLVRVEEHRIVHRCVRLAALGERPWIWRDCVDHLHPTVELFHAGLPHERDFVINY